MITRGDAVGGANFRSFSFQPLRAIWTSDSNLTYVFLCIHFAVVHSRLLPFAVVCSRLRYFAVWPKRSNLVVFAI